MLALFGQMRDCARLLLADTASAEVGVQRDIVVIGSTAGRTVSSANPVYGATKFALQVEADCGPLLVPEDMAHAIAFTVSQPAHVHIDDIRLRPTRQKIQGPERSAGAASIANIHIPFMPCPIPT